MKLSDVVTHFGTQVKAAQALGLTQGTISLWGKRGIPLKRQFQIETATQGALQADRPTVEAPCA